MVLVSGMTATTAILKATLTTGVIVLAAVLIVGKMGTFVIRFRNNNNNNTRLISNVEHKCQKGDNYLNRRDFKIRSSDFTYDAESRCQSDVKKESGEREEEFASQTRQQFLLVADEYNAQDVVQCIDSLWIKRNKRPITIAFVGDSTTRQHFVSFVRSIPDYDRQTESLNTKTVEILYHDDMNLTSRLMGNLKISFYWRNLINEVMLADFRRWASTEDHAQVPDLILFGATVHHMIASNNVTFEMYEKLLVNELVPLMKKSLLVHPHQEIIWLKQSLTIEQLSPADENHVAYGIYPDKIEKYVAILPRILKDTRVVIWDSMNAIAEEYIRACGLTSYYDRQDEHEYQHCHDLIHTGMGAISLGTRLLLNHICESAESDEFS